MHDEHYEAVARRAAESLVRTNSMSPGQYPPFNWSVSVDTETVRITEHIGSERAATDWANVLKGELSRAILAAIREALALPLPGGLSHEDIQDMKDIYVGTAPEHADIELLLDHIDHLTRLLHDCESGALMRWSESYKGAFEAGALAQRRIDNLAAYDAARGIMPTSDFSSTEAAAIVARAVGVAPIASLDREG